MGRRTAWEPKKVCENGTCESCSHLDYNAAYLTYPIKYRCSLTNEMHILEHRCDVDAPDMKGKVKKIDFDKRICDVEPGASNTETYREFLINSIRYFYGESAKIPDFDSMSEEELNDRIEEMDYLWEK